MRNHYILGVDPEPKVIGVKDGGAQAEIQRGGFRDKKLYDRILSFLGSYDSWSRAKEEPDFDVELQYVKLKRSAIVTDFMQFGPVLLNCPFLVSEKAKSILINYKIADHKFYPADLHTKGGDVLRYYLFFCRSLDFQVINFEDSIIFQGLEKTEESVIKINSWSEYDKLLKNSVKIIQFDKYVLNEKFDCDLDLFVLGSTVVATEEVCHEILGAGLTGMQLKPAFGVGLWRPTVQTSHCKSA